MHGDGDASSWVRAGDAGVEGGEMFEGGVKRCPMSGCCSEEFGFGKDEDLRLVGFDEAR